MDLFNQINSDTLVITPNLRLSAYLKDQYHQHLVQNRRNERSICIMPIQSWLNSLWQIVMSYEQKRAMKNEHELFLWEMTIRESQVGESLLDIKSTARSAKQAWHLCHEWGVDYFDEQFSVNENTHSFQGWCHEFKKKCNEKHLQTSVEIISSLIKHADNLIEFCPKQVLLYDFLELTPLQETFFLCLKKQGIQVTPHDNYIENKNLSIRAFHEQSSEYINMARFAKREYEKNPKAKIGCIILNLQDEKEQIERSFSEVFGSNHEIPVDYSAGKPLSHHPPIQCINNLLQLVFLNFKIEKVSELIISPFIVNAETHLNTRHLLDRQLRSCSNHSLNFQQTIDLLKTHRKTRPYLDESLGLLLEHLGSVKTKQLQTPGLIAEQILYTLKDIGWPGERNLNSEEYQVVKKAIELLKNIKLFQCVSNKLSIKQAVKLYIETLQNTLFQIEKEKQPIQVLGMLEGAGMSFDATWIAGYNDTAMPTPPQSNPFIPITLQAKHAIPHSTAEREFSFCKRMTEQFLTHHHSITFSYSLFCNGNEQRISQLIADLGPVIISEVEHHSITPTTSSLEYYQDDTAPTFNENHLPGGTETLRKQSNCPFQAFAKHRLNARTLESDFLGINALERGTITHTALEEFWKVIPTQAALKKLTAEEEENLIHRSIRTAFRAHKIPSYFSPALVNLEEIHLSRLLKDWLNKEKERAPFTVKQLEKKQSYSFDQLTISMKIDRIDEDTQGNTLLIDYKTGNASIKDWFGYRIKQPQLPLYLVSSQSDNSNSILFAEIKLGGTLKGVSQHPIASTEIKTLDEIRNPHARHNWNEQLHLWQEQLNGLITEFKSGNAIVKPLDASSCQYCDLHSLCRILEHE
jgi:ATP-dependent helicase/nuclease subunit B